MRQENGLSYSKICFFRDTNFKSHLLKKNYSVTKHLHLNDGKTEYISQYFTIDFISFEKKVVDYFSPHIIRLQKAVLRSAVF